MLREYKYGKPGESGIALIMVLGVLAVLLILAVTFAFNMRLEQRAARNYLDYMAADFHAKAGLEHAVTTLRNQTWPQELLDKFDAGDEVDYEEDDFYYKIIPLSGRLDVNFTGAARVLGTVVPGFVARNRGHVVLTGSLAGFRGLPGSIGYGSSKAGLMHLAESMHADLRGTGVEVQLANPGFIRTRLTDKNEFHMPFLMEPDQAAAEMFTLMSGNRFKRSFPWAFSLVFRGAQFLPDALYYRLFGAKG